MFDVILITKISLIHKNYFQTDKMQVKDFSFYFIKCLYLRIDRNGKAHCKKVRNSLMIGHLARSPLAITLTILRPAYLSELFSLIFSLSLSLCENYKSIGSLTPNRRCKYIYIYIYM